jgi:hypothetical protein
VTPAQGQVPNEFASSMASESLTDDTFIQTVNVIFESVDDSQGFTLSPQYPPHIVTGITSNSHAAKNGLRNGDVITFVGGFDVQDMPPPILTDFLENATKNGPVQGLVFRAGLVKTSFHIIVSV